MAATSFPSYGSCDSGPRGGRAAAGGSACSRAQWVVPARGVALPLVLLVLHLLDRDDDRQRKGAVELVGHLNAVRVVHREPSPRRLDHLDAVTADGELMVEKVALRLQRHGAVGELDRVAIAE